jgi:hypothetical protein
MKSTHSNLLRIKNCYHEALFVATCHQLLRTLVKITDCNTKVLDFFFGLGFWINPSFFLQQLSVTEK